LTAPITVRVISVRSQNPRGFGGAIFAGVPVATTGAVTDATSYVVVRASQQVLGWARVEQGQWWCVRGPVIERRTEVNGFQMTEQQIEADEATLARPSGRHIVAYLADKIDGIGTSKAQRLWDTLGEGLYHALDTADRAALSRVLTPEIADRLVLAWVDEGKSRTLQWLQAHGFNVRLGRKILDFFGDEAAARIEDDPYRLLSFCGEWKKVDRLATEHFGLARNDPRRLQGAVEEACYHHFDIGHTAMLSAALMDYAVHLLGKPPQGVRWRDQTAAALSGGLANGTFVKGHHGLQPLGALVMEKQVANAVAARLSAASGPLTSQEAVDRIINSVHTEDNIKLNEGQQAAIHAAAQYEFLCVTGSAGCGKTTVLRSVYRMYDQVGVKVIQVALAGRAAKRMHETTGRPSSTIAGFLKSVDGAQLQGPTVLVVDEASMVDIISMSRICDVLPRHVRMLLVGDPNQLMPVGPGLVLHALAGASGVPTVELQKVERHAGKIAEAANEIRSGLWPTFTDDETADIAFLPCNSRLIAETVVELLALDRTRSQVLCAVREGPAGVKVANALCQERFTAQAPSVSVWNSEFDCEERLGLRQGDTVLCTRNMWAIGLQNGSLGTVAEVVSASSVPTSNTVDSAEQVVAWVDWDDGSRRALTTDMLDDVDLGYAITVHKAQGSQWPRVIVPVAASKYLDRTLLYTALTRAQSQVLFVGDIEAARAAVSAPPRAAQRKIALDLHLASLLRSGGSH
jgi:exodeoxyribonuclease V alpha subunit